MLLVLYILLIEFSNNRRFLIFGLEIFTCLRHDLVFGGSPRNWEGMNNPGIWIVIPKNVDDDVKIAGESK